MTSVDAAATVETPGASEHSYSTGAALLEIKDLVTTFRAEDGETRAVDGVSFTVHKGERLGLVGESGCGKSTIALSVMGLLPTPIGRVASGDVLLNGVSLVSSPAEQLRRLRGKDIAMIFQDAMTSLNPLLSVGRQIEEIVQVHQGLDKRAARERALELLRMVGISAPERRLKAYPHELSGGMAQRVMIAIALACDPQLVIADEPTTALDVTVQEQILELLRSMCERLHTSVILITHDLGVVAGMTDRVAVMYAGDLVEVAPTPALFAEPAHPYTLGLLESVPRIDDVMDQDLPTIGGSVEGASKLRGCKFAPRCRFAQRLCWEKPPPLEFVADDHSAACWVDVAATGNAQQPVLRPTANNQLPS